MAEDYKSYREKVEIQGGICDMAGQWRMSAILNTFQEVAEGQCKGLGCGWTALREKGLAWVVIQNEVQMLRYPRITEQVQVETWAGKCRHAFFPRYYEIKGMDGTLLGQASSMWVLYDLKEGKMGDPAAVKGLVPENTERRSGLLPGKIERPEGGSYREMKYMPLYSHMDANGHVNNTRYVDIFCDAIGLQAFWEARIEDIIIHYNEQVLPETELTLGIWQEGNLYRMTGQHGEKIMFEIGCRMGPSVE